MDENFDNGLNSESDDMLRQQQEEAAYQREREAEEARIKQFQRQTENTDAVVNGMNDIYQKKIAQQQAQSYERGSALMGAMENMMSNPKGELDSSLFGTMSQSFGMPISGGMIVNKGKYAGSIVLGSPVTDKKGNAVGVKPSMMISPEEQYKIFANHGERGEKMQSALYQIIKAKSGLTDRQMYQNGITNPMNHYSSGGTTISGTAARMLFGNNQRKRSSISAFAADGKGGFTNYESNADTGYQLTQRNSGTRADGYTGKWHTTSHGGGKIVQYNDKTGERRVLREDDFSQYSLSADRNQQLQNEKLKLQYAELASNVELKKLGINAQILAAAYKNGDKTENIIKSIYSNKDIYESFTRGGEMFEDKDGNRVSEADAYEVGKDGKKKIKEGFKRATDLNGNQIYSKLTPEETANKIKSMMGVISNHNNQAKEMEIERDKVLESFGVKTSAPTSTSTKSNGQLTPEEARETLNRRRQNAQQQTTPPATTQSREFRPSIETKTTQKNTTSNGTKKPYTPLAVNPTQVKKDSSRISVSDMKDNTASWLAEAPNESKESVEDRKQNAARKVVEDKLIDNTIKGSEAHEESEVNRRSQILKRLKQEAEERRELVREKAKDERELAKKRMAQLELQKYNRAIELISEGDDSQYNEMINTDSELSALLEDLDAM